jgi:hypothetical protein
MKTAAALEGDSILGIPVGLLAPDTGLVLTASCRGRVGPADSLAQFVEIGPVGFSLRGGGGAGQQKAPQGAPGPDPF